MRTSSVLFLGLLFILGGSVARAGINDSIDSQKEEELEADETAQDIHDLESEQKFAREQARVQEQTKDASDKRLKALAAHKAAIQDKIRLDISLAEQRRKNAEAENAVNQKQIQALQYEIRNLQIKRDQALKAADKAKETSKAGREMIDNLKVKKAKATEENRDAQIENQKAQRELARLQNEAQHLKHN